MTRPLVLFNGHTSEEEKNISDSTRLDSTRVLTTERQRSAAAIAATTAPTTAHRRRAAQSLEARRPRRCWVLSGLSVTWNYLLPSVAPVPLRKRATPGGTKRNDAERRRRNPPPPRRRKRFSGTDGRTLVGRRRQTENSPRQEDGAAIGDAATRRDETKTKSRFFRWLAAHWTDRRRRRRTSTGLAASGVTLSSREFDDDSSVHKRRDGRADASQRRAPIVVASLVRSTTTKWRVRSTTTRP